MVRIAASGRKPAGSASRRKSSASNAECRVDQADGVSRAFIFGLPRRVDPSARSANAIYDAVGHNTGNLAFSHAIADMIGDEGGRVSWFDPPAAINRMSGTGVMPCANQIGPHADFAPLVPAFRQLSMPLVAIGLGAQSASVGSAIEMPAGTAAWLREIASRAPGRHPNIGVRGAYSKQALDGIGLGDRAAILGCPSLFLNRDPRLGEVIGSRTGRPIARVAVTAGHPGWTELSGIEASLVEIASATEGAYIVQSPFDMVALGLGAAGEVSEAGLASIRDYCTPGLSIAGFLDWSRRFARVFLSVPDWLAFLKPFDFVVGTRVHGVMMGLQAGVPGLCVAHDSRTEELCATMGVPCVRAADVRGGIRLGDLWALFRFQPDRFDERRRSLAADFETFLAGNGLPARPLLD